MIAGEQQSRVIELLRGIKERVTADDRKEAERALGITQATITRYLSKLDAPNETLALKIFNVLNKRIKARDKEIDILLNK
jgi:Fic family protein